MNPENSEAKPIEPKLRAAQTSDARFVLWLEEVCMKDYAIALWGAWRQSATLQTIDLAGHEIIELDNQPVGCVALTRFEAFVRVDRLYLGPDFRNLGVGAIVLGRVTDRARRAGLPVRLSVLTTNPALNFYLREGFVIENEDAERRTLVKE